MPDFAEVDDALGGSVRFVGVNPVDDAAAARSFAASVAVKLPPKQAFEFGIHVDI